MTDRSIITIALPAAFTAAEAERTIVAVLREQARLDLIEARETDPKRSPALRAADRLATALLPWAS